MQADKVLDPIVSVITPCRDAARWLDEAIGSVRAQTLAEWELIIVDDASRDDSLAIARAHAASDPRIRVEPMSRPVGSAAARNRALDLARGRFVAFLDADDVWRPGKLAAQVRLMHERGAVFSFTAYEKSDVDGLLSGRVFVPPVRIDHATLLRTCAIGCSTVMLDRAFLGDRRMPAMRRSHDYALWLDLLRDGTIAHGLVEPWTIYRARPGSLSANKVAKYAAAWRIYRARENLGVADALRCMMSYAVHGVRKRIL